MRKLLPILFLFVGFALFAQEQDSTYMFRLLLLDKGESGFSTQEPRRFLSEKAIDRRIRQGIDIDETDLPISSAYLSMISAAGVRIVAQSKWVQTVTVRTENRADTALLLSLPFVERLQMVYRGILKPVEEDTVPLNPFPTEAGQTYTDYYGRGFSQIAMHNGNLLHEAGYRGDGMTIAVFDGGFHNVDKIDAFAQDRIAGAKDFTHMAIDPFRIKSQHGTRVLSCMLSGKENVMVGTAPEASYYLFCSEVDGIEFPVEEDYWIAGVEYADSLGVDIITTSLGYTVFDDSTMNHHQSQLDGESILMSRAATRAAEKGIFVLNAAGNEGGKTWNTISVPSDARDILTVGAIKADGSPAGFTPAGPTADGRTKPDVVSLGVGTGLIASNGALTASDGTSYATPVLAGLTACLWQALPELNCKELLQLIQSSSDRYAEPDKQYGYGIPDMFKAYEKKTSINRPGLPEKTPLVRHIGAYLFIDTPPELFPLCKLTVYTMIGEKAMGIDSLQHASVRVNHLPGGMYIALLEGPSIHQACKFIIR